MASSATTSGSATDWRGRLGRLGIAARGVLYVALGALALQVAFAGGSGGSVSERGAIELIARQPFGRVLLVVLTVGLFALAAWQLVTAVTGDPAEGNDASDRAKFGVKGILYLATGITAATITAANWGASSGGGAGGGGGTDQAAATLMSLPGGVWLVGALGVLLIVVGGKQIYDHTVNTEFMSRLDTSSMSASARSGVERGGRAGYAAKGLVAVLIGAFFVVAAQQHDPSESRGLSGSLQTISEQPWGPYLLGTVAAGMFLYGAFSLAESRYRKAA